MRTDLLVVGGGLAGAAAALEAAAAGARVVLAAQGPGASHLAQGGIAAAVAAGDSAALHAEDTVAAGAGACDPVAVADLTREGPAAVAWLERQGVAFDHRADGGFDPALEAAHSRPRIVHAGDRTGSAIMAALDGRLREAGGGLVRLSGVRLVRLLGDGTSCFGGILQGASGAIRVEAAATILATGGFAGLYERTVSPGTGAGLMAALAAGAELADLEFVQFHPTVYAGPGTAFLLTEALRGAGARITDVEGRAFLARVDPRGELAPRSVVARAIAERLAATGEPFALLDARSLGAGLASGFPGFVAACAARGIDPRREPVPIAPAAHYTMGGIVTDLAGRTAVRGLLAAGECARTGLHGANRLASNALLEAVVMGRRAARTAGGWQAWATGTPPEAAGLELGATPASGALLSRLAGLVRSRDGLKAAVERLDGLPALVARSALLRTESRGTHHRTDAPQSSPRWAGCEVRVRLREGGVNVAAAQRTSRPEARLTGRA